MTNASPTAVRADDLARYSAAAGVLAVALLVIARTLLVYLLATGFYTRHPGLDWTRFSAPAPAYICAVLAVVLGIAGLRHRDKARTWAVVGTTIGVTFLVITLAEVPTSILPYILHPEPGPQQ